MSGFRDSVKMDQLRGDAEKQIDQTILDCTNVRSRLYERLNGRSKVNIYGGLVGTILWIVAYAGLNLFISANIIVPIALTLLISTCLLMIAKIVSISENIRYYGAIANRVSDIDRFIRSLQKAEIRSVRN